MTSPSRNGALKNVMPVSDPDHLAPSTRPVSVVEPPTWLVTAALLLTVMLVAFAPDTIEVAANAGWLITGWMPVENPDDMAVDQPWLLMNTGLMALDDPMMMSKLAPGSDGTWANTTHENGIVAVKAVLARYWEVPSNETAGR